MDALGSEEATLIKATVNKTSNLTLGIDSKENACEQLGLNDDANNINNK